MTILKKKCQKKFVSDGSNLSSDTFRLNHVSKEQIIKQKDLFLNINLENYTYAVWTSLSLDMNIF